MPAYDPGMAATVADNPSEHRYEISLDGEVVGFTLYRSRLAVLPFCPFVNGYVQRHREYAGLVPAEYRKQFGL